MQASQAFGFSTDRISFGILNPIEHLEILIVNHYDLVLSQLY
jgi:hypothetical protein